MSFNRKETRHRQPRIQNEIVSIKYVVTPIMVPMVLNPNGIEPTFLKLDSWSPGAGLIPIITSNILNLIKKKEFKKKNSFMHTKTFNAVFKNGFNPVLGSITRLPPIIYRTYIIYKLILINILLILTF